MQRTRKNKNSVDRHILRVKVILAALLLLIIVISQSSSQIIRVGSKHFNESYILGEIISQLFEANGYRVERKFNLGGTLVCYESLINNQIDVYPEYTGTIAEAILKLDQKTDLAGLEVGKSFGFNNTYALAVKRKTADGLNLSTISDLSNHPEIKAAVSYEFLKRKDGWDNLSSVYGLQIKPAGIDHGLAYQALDEGKIQLTDVYSTDGEIPKYDLVLLRDDRNFFPQYFGVPFYRLALDPKAKSLLATLANTLSDSLMQSLNARVIYEKKSASEVAHGFLIENNLIGGAEKFEKSSVYSEILQKTLRHLEITIISLLLAIVIAFPVGVLLSLYPAIARPVLYSSGLLQTIPSIALLAIMIPLFGIGLVPAVAALFLYALLPILRNTASGIFSVDPLIKKVATGIGLTRIQRLRYVDIPLAMPAIFAGIKTAAVINIGTATLAAFIGAGGLGEFIVTGLALNDTGLILQGAIPAAILAILAEFLFELLEKFLIPKHLKQKISN
jgi:osmoprotectant transport system permease protein